MMDYILCGLMFAAGLTLGGTLGVILGIYLPRWLFKRKLPPKGSIVMVITPDGVPGILKLQQLAESSDPAKAVQKACELYMLLLQQQSINDAEIVLRAPTGEEQVLTIM